MKLKLLPKFIISLGVVGLVLTIAVSLFGYANTKNRLEETYAESVMSNSDTIAEMLDPVDVQIVIGEKGNETDVYKNMCNLFNEIKKKAKITYLSLVVLSENSVTFYIDAMVEEMGDDPLSQMPYGTTVLYTDAANPEDPADLQKYVDAWERYKENKGTEKPFLTDNSYGYNYSFGSIILDEDGKAIAEVQYILDMSDLKTYLNSFLVNMVLISFAVIAVTLVAYIFFVRVMVTRPIGKLTDFTEEITRNNAFEGQSVEIKTGDEIESLSDSFNIMLEKLEDYIANLSKITAEKERIGAELDVARHIQASMLPCIFPAFPQRSEFDIFASMTPAKEVGGDFYDFFLVDDDHLAMVMADVSGKGVPAALFMMISKTLIKSAAQNGLSPKAVLEKVNNQLCENNDAEMFVTVWLGILEISSGKMKCANAGHEYPAIMRKGGDFELFRDKHGFVLAGMEGAKYREYEIELNAGDRLFVYTDGVPEATNSSEELYGTDRMLLALNKAKDESCQDLLGAVHRDVDAFTGEADQFDDITMLCLELKSTSAMKSISVVPSSETLTDVTNFVEGVVSEANVPAKIASQINIAVDEIVSNVVNYSGATLLKTECGVNESEVTVRFSDNGKPYNPTEKPDPDTTLSAEERKIGGLGIFMVKKTMDEFSYEYKDERNVLTIVKKL